MLLQAILAEGNLIKIYKKDRKVVTGKSGFAKGNSENPMADDQRPALKLLALPENPNLTASMTALVLLFTSGRTGGGGVSCERKARRDHGLTSWDF